MCSVSPADTGCSMESPAPDHHDPHSSEEELEVINSIKDVRPSRPLRAASVCLPEKRKWSQVIPISRLSRSHYTWQNISSNRLASHKPISYCRSIDTVQKMRRMSPITAILVPHHLVPHLVVADFTVTITSNIPAHRTRRFTICWPAWQPPSNFGHHHQ